ncbi:hypothetical protein M8494_34425 (plasmid) [Serratia ureilytica]
MNWYQLHLEKSSSPNGVEITGDELFAMVKAFNENQSLIPAANSKAGGFSGAICIL